MPAEAALSTAEAVELSAAAVAAPPTEARPGVTTATGRSQAIREVSGTGSGITTPVTRMAASAADSKEVAGATADPGSATVSNSATSTAHSTATAAAAAEWVK